MGVFVNGRGGWCALKCLGLMTHWSKLLIATFTIWSLVVCLLVLKRSDRLPTLEICIVMIMILSGAGAARDEVELLYETTMTCHIAWVPHQWWPKSGNENDSTWLTTSMRIRKKRKRTFAITTLSSSPRRPIVYSARGIIITPPSSRWTNNKGKKNNKRRRNNSGVDLTPTN